MWKNKPPEKVDISAANGIAYHWAIAMTTDLNFNMGTQYSATDMFNQLNIVSIRHTRSSIQLQLSLNTIKRALSTKWARTAIHTLYRNIEFGPAFTADDIIIGEFGKGQYIKFNSAQFLYSFTTDEENKLKLVEYQVY